MGTKMKRIAAVLFAVIVMLGVLPCRGKIWAASKEAALQPCETVANADGTVTLYVVIDGNIRGFDFGVAFSLAEATPVSYGFTDAFLEACGEQNGTALDHYFEDGERVSGSDRYFVFGGMANSDAVYTGRMAYVTFALTGAPASVSVIKESAAYASATEIREKGTVYTLIPQAAVTSQPDGGSKGNTPQTGAPAGVGGGQNGTNPGAGGGQNGNAPGTDTGPGVQSGSGQGRHDASGTGSGRGTNDAADASSGANAADGVRDTAKNNAEAGGKDASDGRPKTGDPAHIAGYFLLVILSLLMEISLAFVLKHRHIDVIMKKISIKKRRDENASGDD